MTTTQLSPPRAAYAAAAAPALPDEAMITRVAPNSLATLIPTEVGLSLKEAVGFVPSVLEMERGDTELFPQSLGKKQRSIPFSKRDPVRCLSNGQQRGKPPEASQR